MIAELHRPIPPDPGEPAPPPPTGGPPKPKPPVEILARAVWDGRRVSIQANDPEIEAAVRRIVRPTPVLIQRAADRSKGASGPSVIQPGSLEWFRAAVLTRAPAEGLAVRFAVPGITGGWDPAATYRPFREQVRRLDVRG